MAAPFAAILFKVLKKVLVYTLNPANLNKDALKLITSYLEKAGYKVIPKTQQKAVFEMADSINRTVKRFKEKIELPSHLIQKGRSVAYKVSGQKMLNTIKDQIIAEFFEKLEQMGGKLTVGKAQEYFADITDLIEKKYVDLLKNVKDLRSDMIYDIIDRMKNQGQDLIDVLKDYAPFQTDKNLKNFAEALEGENIYVVADMLADIASAIHFLRDNGFLINQRQEMAIYAHAFGVNPTTGKAKFKTYKNGKKVRIKDTALAINTEIQSGVWKSVAYVTDEAKRIKQQKITFDAVIEAAEKLDLRNVKRKNRPTLKSFSVDDVFKGIWRKKR